MVRSLHPALAVGAWLLLLALLLALSLRGYNSFQLGTYGDDARYAVLARSIALSDTYGLIVGPGPPLPTGYPFGFPLLLAPLAKLYPDAPETMQVVSLAATVVNVSLLFWGWPLLSQVRSRWWALAVAALYTVAPNVIGHTRMVMSEAVFTSWVLTVLLLTEHLARRGRPAWGLSATLGLALAGALFVRTIGVLLYPVVLLRLLRAPARRPAPLLAGMAIGGLALVVPVLLFTPVAPHHLLPTRYWQAFEQPSIYGWEPAENSLATRFTRGVSEYARRRAREAIIPFGGGGSEAAFGRALNLADLPSVTGMTVTALVLLGSMSQLCGRGLAPAAFLFEVLYLGVVLAWPFRSARYLYPVQPFLFYQLLAGVHLLGSGIVRPLGRAAGLAARIPDAAVVGVVVVLCSAALYRDTQTSVDSRRYVRDFRVGTSWLKEHSPPDAVVMAQEPQTIHLYSQRPTLPYPEVSSGLALRDALDRYGVDYILVGPLLQWRTDGVLEYDARTLASLPLFDGLAVSGELRLVYEAPPHRVRIYRVEQRGSSPGT